MTDQPRPTRPNRVAGSRPAASRPRKLAGAKRPDEPTQATSAAEPEEPVEPASTLPSEPVPDPTPVPADEAPEREPSPYLASLRVYDNSSECEPVSGAPRPVLPLRMADGRIEHCVQLTDVPRWAAAIVAGAHVTQDEASYHTPMRGP